MAIAERFILRETATAEWFIFKLCNFLTISINDLDFTSKDDGAVLWESKICVIWHVVPLSYVGEDRRKLTENCVDNESVNHKANTQCCKSCEWITWERCVFQNFSKFFSSIECSLFVCNVCCYFAPYSASIFIFELGLMNTQFEETKSSAWAIGDLCWHRWRGKHGILVTVG